MKLKAGVSLEGAQWQIWYAAIIVERVLLEQFGAELWITSVCDGKHRKDSLHYKGLAFDVRTWGIKGRELQVVAALKKALGPDYDVVLEATHIHIEFDPD